MTKNSTSKAASSGRETETLPAARTPYVLQGNDNMRHLLIYTFIGCLISAAFFAGCETQTVEPEDTTTLPLSPGISVASNTSGGIAGITEIIQVSDDWQLIVVSGDQSFVRRLDGEEQRMIRTELKSFATLGNSQSENVPDGFNSTIIARGDGQGPGTAEHAKALGEILSKLKSAPQQP